jgi:hypothetical protein
MAIILTISSVHVAGAEPKQKPIQHLTWRTRTPINRIALADVLRRGHIRFFGEAPGDKRLAMAWSQVGLENGQGREVYNHNLGNIVKWSKDHFYFRYGKHRYRSLDTFEDGAVAYWTILNNCPGALHAFDKGNVAASAIELKRCNYYEAPVKSYTSPLFMLYHLAIKEIIPSEESERDKRGSSEGDAGAPQID